MFWVCAGYAPVKVWTSGGPAALPPTPESPQKTIRLRMRTPHGAYLLTGACDFNKCSKTSTFGYATRPMRHIYIYVAHPTSHTLFLIIGVGMRRVCAGYFLGMRRGYAPREVSIETEENICI